MCVILIKPKSFISFSQLLAWNYFGLLWTHMNFIAIYVHKQWEILYYFHLHISNFIFSVESCTSIPPVFAKLNQILVPKWAFKIQANTDCQMVSDWLMAAITNFFFLNPKKA